MMWVRWPAAANRNALVGWWAGGQAGSLCRYWREAGAGTGEKRVPVLTRYLPRLSPDGIGDGRLDRLRGSIASHASSRWHSRRRSQTGRFSLRRRAANLLASPRDARRGPAGVALLKRDVARQVVLDVCMHLHPIWLQQSGRERPSSSAHAAARSSQRRAAARDVASRRRGL
jgi:hypothetical protein